MIVSLYIKSFVGVWVHRSHSTGLSGPVEKISSNHRRRASAGDGQSQAVPAVLVLQLREAGSSY